MKKSTLGTGLACSFLLSAVHAATLHVESGGYGSSCSAIDPCGSIQQAVNLATASDQIRIGEGSFVENVEIPPGKNGLEISGKGMDRTTVTSAGGLSGKFAPAGVPLDAVFDIFSADISLEKMTISHPAGTPVKRDIAVFVRPPASNTEISQCRIRRDRDSGNLEPTQPGSRGIFVIRAGGTEIEKNQFRGNYEDAIHIPAPDSEIVKNDILDAPRLGIVIIQETTDSNSRGNVIMKNSVIGSGSDGIQIQGDQSLVAKNTVSGSGGAGIRLCGAQVGDCVAPGDAAVAESNSISKNMLSDNAGGAIVDDGTGNSID